MLGVASRGQRGKNPRWPHIIDIHLELEVAAFQWQTRRLSRLLSVTLSEWERM